MKITLAEAVNLKSIIGKKIQELLSERTDVSTVTVVNKEDYKDPERTVEDITKELNEARADIRKLTFILSEANLKNTVTWDGADYSLTVALELAKQLRGEVNALKGFAKRKKEDIVTNHWGGNDNKYIITTYEPKEYKELSQKLERQINKLSSDINHKNYTIEIEFPEARKYM